MDDITEAIGHLRNAADSLTSYLLDNTDEVFEEDPDIDNARAEIYDVVGVLQKRRESVLRKNRRVKMI